MSRPSTNNFPSVEVRIFTTPQTIKAIAHVLNADAAGLGYSSADGDQRDDFLYRVVAQAAVRHLLNGPAIKECVERDYANFGKLRRRQQLRQTPPVKKLVQPNGVEDIHATITRHVARAFDVPLRAVLSRDRSEPVAWARMVTFHLAKTLTTKTARGLSHLFHCDQSTITYGCRRVRDRLTIDQRFAAQVAALQSACAGTPTVAAPQVL